MDKSLSPTRMEHYNNADCVSFLLLPSQIDELKERLIANAMKKHAAMEDSSIVYEYWTAKDLKERQKRRAI